MIYIENLNKLSTLAMLQRFSKLSLKKTSKISNMDCNDDYTIPPNQVANNGAGVLDCTPVNSNMDREDDYIIPPNQEANNRIEDLDLTLDLPEDNTFTNQALEGVNQIRQILQYRLSLAKKRESLLHGQKNGQYPIWFSLKLNCSLNLEDVGEEDTFNNYWKELSTSTRMQLAKKIIEHLTKRIKEREAEANKVRAETIKKIGFATVESDKLRQQLDKDILSINNNSAKELDEFRQHISKSSHDDTSADGRRNTLTVNFAGRTPPSYAPHRHQPYRRQNSNRGQRRDRFRDSRRGSNRY